MNPLLLILLFGGGAYALSKSKKKTAISYPSEGSSSATGYANNAAWKEAVSRSQTANSQEEFNKAVSDAQAAMQTAPAAKSASAALPWIQPDRSQEDWLREMSPLQAPGTKDYELAAFLGAYLGGLNAFGQDAITIKESDFDMKLKIAGLENRKSEAFVGLANFSKSAPNKVILNLANGGVAEAYKVNYDEFTKVIPPTNPNSVVSNLPNPKAINNNIGIIVPFGVGGSILTDENGNVTSSLGVIGSKGAYIANNPANKSGIAQVIAFNTPKGNLLVSYSKDPQGFGRDVHNIVKVI